MVIGFTAKDGHGAINLFGEEESHHLVRKSELRQGEFLLGKCVNLR